MRIRVGSVAFLGACLALLGSAPGDKRSFRTEVAAVRLQVLVTRGRVAVAGLRASDFEVTDNGVRQQVAGVFSESAPLDVLLVMDRSASIAGEPLEGLKRAATSLIDALNTDDRCGVVTFSHHVSVDVAIGKERERTKQALQSMRAEGLTSLLDALYSALELVEPGDRRNVVVLFSDGRDNRSWTSKERITTEAGESEAVINAVAFDPGRPTSRGSEDVSRPDVPLLTELASATGGEVIVAKRPDEFQGAFSRLLGRARARYLLTYSPPSAAPGWHEVKVKVKGGGVEVLARRGYEVPTPRQ